MPVPKIWPPTLTAASLRFATRSRFAKVAGSRLTRVWRGRLAAKAATRFCRSALPPIREIPARAASDEFSHQISFLAHSGLSAVAFSRLSGKMPLRADMFAIRVGISANSRSLERYTTRSMASSAVQPVEQRRSGQGSPQRTVALEAPGCGRASRSLRAGGRGSGSSGRSPRRRGLLGLASLTARAGNRRIRKK